MKIKFKTLLILVFLFTYSYSNESKLDRILQTNEIKVCIWPQYYSITYIDPRTQELTGIDSDLSKELAKDLGVKLKLVKSSFPTLIKDVKSNKCDLAMFAIGKTKKRMEKLRFTTPHLKSDIYAITTKSNKKIRLWEDIDKEGIIVAIAKGTFHEPIMKKKLKKSMFYIVKLKN